MILSQAQAEVCYRNMCELNNVGGTAKIEIRSNSKYIEVDATGAHIVVRRKSEGKPDGSEIHLDQTAFAKAYGLN